MQAKKHGLSNSKIYKKYIQIKQRCYNERRGCFKNYGGRGITMCDEWKNDFICFYNWAINNGYKDDLSIDRIDVNGNYEPNNCRWVDIETQANNRRNNHIVDLNGEKYTISNISKKFNINEGTIWSRIKQGKTSMEELTAKPYEKRKRTYITLNGETKSLIEWCKIYGKKKTTVFNRIKLYGYTPEEALTKKLKNGKFNPLLGA